MTTPTATAEVPRQRRGRPESEPIVVVQPPAKYAHLSGEDLFQALTTDKEEWDSARFAAEIGRSLGRFRVMVSHRYAVDEGRRKLDDRTPPTPWSGAYVNPRWRAGDARQWAMGVRLMTRRGVFKPHKPGGKGVGCKDVNPRKLRPAPVRTDSVRFLEEYRVLREGGAGTPGVSAAHAKETLAVKHGLSVRQIVHRLHLARKEVARQAAAGGQG
jgi:hypothetical protein